MAVFFPPAEPTAQAFTLIPKRLRKPAGPGLIVLFIDFLTNADRVESAEGRSFAASV